jgi:IgA Peptidase M64
VSAVPRRPLLGVLALVAAAGVASPDPAKRPQVRTWLESGPSASCVDVVFVGDGYQRKHFAPTGKYWTDVKRYASRLLEEAPFAWYRDRFNVRAVFLESEDEGCDAAPGRDTARTALDSAFDTADGRLLAFGSEPALARALEGAGEVDIAFVMVNTERYGGAGSVLRSVEVRGRPLPAPTFSARDTPSFLIAVHELGHSFATLGDEYADPETAKNHPLPEDGGDIPCPNLTLATRLDTTDAASLARTVKWSHFLALPGAKKHKWVHEGGFFRETGVFRPWPRCRMRASEDPFCPICCEEMAKAITTACGLSWDDAAFHRDHPLSWWR